MPKPTKIPGLSDYGEDDNAVPATKQTVFPKAQGGQPSPAGPKPTKIPGLSDYGGGTTPSVSAVDSSQAGIFSPQPADLSRPQTWHDWLTRTYTPSGSDIGTAALDDVSSGTADWARSKLTSENIADLRARTADAQAAMGPMGPVVNGLSYAIPGSIVGKGLKAARVAGKVAGALGRYGQAGLEGGIANAASSVGHQLGGYIDPLKVAIDTGIGTAVGVGGQAFGDAASAAVRNISNYVRGSPGRGGEAWNWRTRAMANDPTLPDSIAQQQKARASNDPAQPGLANLQSTLAQSTEPGRMADAIYGTAGAFGGYMGVPPDYALLGGIGGLTAGGVTKQMFGTPGAKAVNWLDKNINVGQSLDRLYPALFGPQKTPALDTSGWADPIRQFTIGSERPGPPGSQVW